MGAPVTSLGVAAAARAEPPYACPAYGDAPYPEPCAETDGDGEGVALTYDDVDGYRTGVDAYGS